MSRKQGTNGDSAVFGYARERGTLSKEREMEKERDGMKENTRKGLRLLLRAAAMAFLLLPYTLTQTPVLEKNI